MAVLDDYDEETIAACRSVMVEVLTILGKHRDHLVIVGGWVPPLVFGGRDHIGSIDVDLAIDWRRLPSHVYETIEKDLLRRGYSREADDPPNRFRRVVKRGDRSIPIKVDLITGDDDPSRKSEHRIIQGLPVWCARGVNVAFDHCTKIELSDTLPDGGKNTVSVQVATAAALVVMKAMTLNERMVQKDAYDIYYCLTHHPDDVEGLATDLAAIADEPTVAEALDYLRKKFATIDSIGPVWAAQVIEEAGGNYDFARRDAFERAQGLFGAINKIRG